MTACIKKGILILPLYIGLTLAASPARAQLGIAAGYGMNIINQPSFSGEAQNTFESPGGINIGIFYALPFGNVALRPGVFLRQSNFDWNLDGVEFSPLQSSIRIAEFPIDVLYRFSTASISPYVLAGPSFNFLHTDQPDLRQTLDKPNGSTSFMGLNVGAGIQYMPPGLGLVLSPEIRYSYALSGFLEENYIVRGVSFASDNAQRISSLTFRLGISFASLGE